MNQLIFHALRILSEQPHAVLLLPTETVYGLVCPFDDPNAVERIRHMKNRSPEKQFTAFIDAVEHLPSEADPPPAAMALARAFCPGPITIVIPTRSGGTFGFRIPAHPFVLPLLREYGKPLASTSANRSGEPNARSMQQALDSLVSAPDFAMDGGTLPENPVASTVVQVFADNSCRILRGGPISIESLRAALKSIPQAKVIS